MSLEVEVFRDCIFTAEKNKGNLCQEGGFVKWSKKLLGDDIDEPTPSEENDVAAQLPKSISVWMSTEEIAHCCPNITDDKLTNQIAVTQAKGIHTDECSESDNIDGENDEFQMASEVNTLVLRARKVMGRIRHDAVVETVLVNTVSILSAYAKIGSLSNCFHLSGAIDLAVQLLSGDFPSAVRRSASEFVQSLSASDSVNKMYVLQKLTKESRDQAVTIESMDLALDIFFKTLVTDERERKEMSLPQVPGRLIYSLVQNYLSTKSCSLLLNRNVFVQNEITMAAKVKEEFLCNHDEFEYFHLLFSLFMEIFYTLGWTFEALRYPQTCVTESSLFVTDTSIQKRKRGQYLKRSDFTSNIEYGQYVKSVLSPGMKVKFINGSTSNRGIRQVDLDGLSYGIAEGDIGEFKHGQEKEGFFSWEDQGGSATWVSWHCVEILPVYEEISIMEEKESKFAQPFKDPYGLSCLHSKNEIGVDACLELPQWWEVLCVLKTLPPTHTDTVISIVDREGIKSFKDLISLHLSIPTITAILSYLKTCVPSPLLQSLSISHEKLFSSFYDDEEDEQPNAISTVKECPPYPEPFLCDDNHASKSPSNPQLNSQNSVNNMLTEMEKNLRKSSSWHKFNKQVKKVEQALTKYPLNCKVAVLSLKALQTGISQLQTSEDHIHCCLSGMFTLILKLMSQEPKSPLLQSLGISCFHSLMDGQEKDVSHLPHFSRRQKLDSQSRNSIIISTMLSLVNGDNLNISLIVDGIRCIVEYYNLKMDAKEKKDTICTVRQGLNILVSVLNHGDYSEISQKFCEWKIDALLNSIEQCGVMVPNEDKLCTILSEALPLQPFDLSGDDDYAIKKAVLLVISAAKQHFHLKSAILKLLTIIGVEDITDDIVFAKPLAGVSELFLKSHGVRYLHEALLSNKQQKGLKESTLALLGCLALEGGDTSAQIVVQGGLKIVMSFLSNSSTEQKIIKLCVKLLTLLSQHYDVLVVMAAELPLSLLNTVKTKVQGKLMKKDMQKLINLLTTDFNDLEAIGNRNKKILSIIVYNIFDIVLTRLDEGRRAQCLPCMPGLKTLSIIASRNGKQLNTASFGSNEGFRSIEVSSAKHSLQKLTDNNPNTYWQSSDSASPPWIKLNMKEDALINKLCIKLGDGSRVSSYYRPGKVTVEGGVSAESTSLINTVIVDSSAHSNYFEVLGPLTIHYPVILLKFGCSRDGMQTVQVNGLICECKTDIGKPLLIFDHLFIARSKLHYHIQSHTWTNKSPVNMLDIFNKMSLAFSYEQWFADHYLSSGSLKQVLGDACKSSLINPFLSSLSQNGKTFFELLRHYFSNTRASPSLCSDLTPILPTNAVLNTKNLTCENLCSEEGVAAVITLSRIRRMCRLLIDCTISKAHGHKSVGNVHKKLYEDYDGGKVLDFISNTWQEVVVSVVSTWLHQCDLKCHPLNVLADFLVTYDRLKQVSVELFAGKSQFMLALQDGFSQALLSLEQTSAVKLCECICLYIDMLLNISSKKSNCQMPNIEAVLFRLVEVVQILHNLEIAFAFEYYYRKLLADRLLCGLSISFSLETKLVQALSQCFPSGQPIKMLDDLEKSKSLIQIFKHDYITEKIDFDVQDWEQTTNQYKQPNHQFIKLARKMELYGDDTFHVSVLTPNCWPLSFRPLPLVLPPPLENFITDYISFYNSVYKSCGRRLEWSLYGGANMVCNKTGVVFSVSTVQMILLLSMNHATELGFQDLLEISHLPSDELSEALSSLISNEHPLLIASTLETPHSKGIPYSKFSVNEKFIEKVAKSTETNLFLTSKPATPSKQKTDDLVYIFQKRKSIIEALIVKMMKKERELSVDTIANTVMRNCSMGQFISGGRFECTYKEVISRIESLICNGYLKRNPAHPQILVYLPLPEEEEVSVHFTTEEASTEKHQNCTDMSADDPQFLMSSGTRSMPLHELKEVLNLQISLSASILGVSVDVAECLLHQFAWNKDRLISEYLRDADSLLKRNGLSALLLREHPKAVSAASCPICLKDDLDDPVGLWCGHVCCKTCWYNHLEASQPLTCTCPFNECLAKPTREFIKKLENEDNQTLLVKFDKAVLHSFVEQSNTVTWCRNPTGCDQVLYCDDGMSSGVCTKCSWSSCFSCSFIEAHQPATCEQLRKWIESGGYYEGMDDDAKSKYLANTISKRCPSCETQIEKTEGCLHIKCKCGFHFCWKCLKPWNPSHSDYFNCKAEESKSAKNKATFVTFSKKCCAYHASKRSAEKMCELVKSTSNPLPILKISFLNNACKILVDCYKMLSYACITRCYLNCADNLSVLMNDLESGVKELQNYLDNIMLSLNQTTYSARKLADQKLQDGYALVSRVKTTREKILLSAKQHFKLAITSAEAATSSLVKPEEEEISSSVPVVNDQMNLRTASELIQAMMFYRAMEEDYHMHDDYFGADDDDDYYYGGYNSGSD